MSLSVSPSPQANPSQSQSWRDSRNSVCVCGGGGGRQHVPRGTQNAQRATARNEHDDCEIGRQTERKKKSQGKTLYCVGN